MAEIDGGKRRSAANGGSYPRMGSGIAFGILAAMAFGTNPLFAKPLYECGFDVDSVLFARFLPATVLMGVIAFCRCRTLKGSWKEVRAGGMAGLLFCLTSFALFMSYRDMDVGVAATLLFVYPVLVAVISGIAFREKIPPVIFAALVLSVGGVVLLCKSSGEAKIGLSGVLLALSAALFYSGYLIWVARSGARKMQPEKLTFYALLTCTLFYFLRIRCGFAVQGEFCAKAWCNVAGLSLISGMLSLACASQALQRSGAMVTSVLGALEPLTAVFFGWAVFHETITAKILCGIGLILISVLMVALRPSAAAEKSAPEPPEKR